MLELTAFRSSTRRCIALAIAGLFLTLPAVGEPPPEDPADDRLRLDAEQTLTEAGRLGQDHATALAHLEQALEAWITLDNLHQQARTLWLLGRQLETSNNFRGASERYGAALELWRPLGDSAGTAATLEGLGRARMGLGEHPRAIEPLEEALTLQQEPGPQATARSLLCLAFLRSGRIHDAGRCYETTLEAARTLGDLELEAQVLIGLDGVYFNLGEPAKQLRNSQRALELRRATGNVFGEAAVLNNLGAFHRRLGEIEQAIALYTRALKLFEQIDNRYWRARTLNNLAVAYLSLGEFERARAFLLQALPLRREVGDRSGEATTLRNLGWVSAKLKEEGKAMAYYRKALERSTELRDRRGAATARKLLGELLLEAGDFATARGELLLALGNLREMGKRLEQAEVLELLARSHLQKGELNESRRWATESLELYGSLENPLGTVAALTTLARIERVSGDLEATGTHLAKARAALAPMEDNLGDPNLRASFLASYAQVHELTIDLLMELHQQAPTQGHNLAALEASERVHSRALLTLLARPEVGLGRDVAPMLAERLRDAERHFAAKTRRRLRVLGGTPTGDEALVAEQELFAAKTSLETLRAEIRRQSPRYAALHRPQTLNAQAIRALLDEDTALLHYSLGEKRSFLWWVTAEAIQSFELPSRRTIEELALEIHRSLAALHQRTPEDRRALEELGQVLLGPAPAHLRRKRLVLLPDGALHLVPFAALGLPSTGEPVLTQHEVVYLPSASVLALQRQRSTQSPPKKTLALFADPVFHRQDPRLKPTPAKFSEASPDRTALPDGFGTLDRLPHTGHEAQAIADLVPPKERLLVTGVDARRERVLEEDLKAYGILHFATHGLLHPRTPELSGLVLSRYDRDGTELNGFLGLYDVTQLELAADLVVLSGCRTALGRQVAGEGLMGLTRAFLHAGTPRVVSSLWQVRDQATARLMTRFYQALLVEKQTPAAALRTAQLALRAERRFRDPFYWAAFSHFGDWR